MIIAIDTKDPRMSFEKHGDFICLLQHPINSTLDIAILLEVVRLTCSHDHIVIFFPFVLKGSFATQVKILISSMITSERMVVVMPKKTKKGIDTDSVLKDTVILVDGNIVEKTSEIHRYWTSNRCSKTELMSNF